MPFFIRISRCPLGHEYTVHVDPINDYEAGITWVCEACAGQGAEGEKAPELRGDEALGGRGNEPGNVVRPEEERQHHVYELVDGRDDQVFYVGVTMNQTGRLYEHGAPNSTSAALPRIQEIRQAGGKYHMRVVASFNDRRRAEAYEAILIREGVGLLNRMLRSV